MNEPVRLGEGDLPPRQPVRIPKKCPECGEEYEGNSFIGLRPGETRAIYPCDGCQEKLEAAERARIRRQFAEKREPTSELQRPQRTRADLDD